MLEGSHTRPGQSEVGSWEEEEQQWRREVGIAQQLGSPGKKEQRGPGLGRCKKAEAAGGEFI